MRRFLGRLTPIAGSSFDAKVTATAWSKKPSYATVSARRSSSPEAMSYFSRMPEVAALIEKAAKAAE